MKKNYIFLCIGIVLFIISTFTAIKTGVEQKSITRTVGLISSFKTDPAEHNKTHLAIQFDLADGKQIEFTTPNSYPQGKYRANETVSVYYPTNAPEQAYLGSFSMRWVGLLALELISLITIIFFLGKTIKQRSMQKTFERLRTTGMSLPTRPLRVELLYRSKKGNARCAIVSVWKDKAGNYHEFKTEPIEQEPETLLEHYRNQTITVYMSQNNPEEYIVDMSFLKPS